MWNVHCEHALASEEGFGGWTEVVERVAVDEQVEEVAVEQRRREEAPELALRDRRVVLAAPGRDPALAGLLQEEGQTVELNQRVGDLAPRVQPLKLLEERAKRVLKRVPFLHLLQAKLELVPRVPVETTTKENNTSRQCL